MEHWKIEIYRSLMGLTQKQFALLIGVKQGTLSKLESGQMRLGQYEEVILDRFNQWKTRKIASLENQIAHIKSI